MSAQQIDFWGAAGQPLTGWLEIPIEGRPIAYALFAHGFGDDPAPRPAVNISRALCRQGMAVLRLGFASPAGGGPDLSGASSVADLVAAARLLEERFDAPRILIGHSLGGAAVLAAAEQIPSALAVATLGAPAGGTGFARGGSADAAKGPADYSTGLDTDEPPHADARLSEELEWERLAEAIRAMRRPLLILHAPRDEVVPVNSAAAIFQAALHPKSFVSLDRADHLLSDDRDADYTGGLIAAWAARYIETHLPTTVEELLAERGVATRTGTDGYRTEVRARQHAWSADEPAAVGGADTGPTPYELLLAALGSCTSMTLRMYADRKKWPLDEVTVRMRHSRIHALDEEQCEHRSPRVDTVDRTVEMRGALTGEQRARLLEIADRCPVHRTLEAGVRIETRAAEAPDAGAAESRKIVQPAEPSA
jgi:uncharacterized OsmC-like protein/fermentation-respiration switch protein FrsA (DUF1100 family)